MRSKGQPVKPSPRPAADALSAGPERWAVDARTGDVAQLNVPPALRDRTFEVFCSLQVRYSGAPNGGGKEAWHGLRVTVNGAQEWARRVPTDSGGRDSLDYRFRRVVPLGEALRVVVTTEVQHAVRTGLKVTAEEE